MSNVEHLTKILQRHKRELYRRYGVIEVGVFGSYVRDEAGAASDVDILVDFEKAIELFTFVNLKNYLSDLLNANVDLVMKKALKPGIGQRILQEVTYV